MISQQQFNENWQFGSTGIAMFVNKTQMHNIGLCTNKTHPVCGKFSRGTSLLVFRWLMLTVTQTKKNWICNIC